ncbi:hypothetical protein CEP54_010449 [Fusarium duplospermum]|uniref:Uncharacterized protein n=1 Tax=Fusarium duplospermum TaxID=1325734 RepID=A0A428PJR9_9HYPO|nr:hypothetical protein CEP54_010449 [Fusarium duplospermum]
MARLRSQGKAAGPVSLPEPRRRGRSRASTSTMTPLKSDVSESSIRPRGRPRKSKASEAEEPPSSQRRQTRSHTDNQTFEKLSTPRRKRRRTIGEPEDQSAKRQHSDDAEGVEEEEQSSQNHDQAEDDGDDESAPPGQDFFKNINKTILPDAEQIHKLPELRPDDNAEYYSENEGRRGIVVELAQDNNEDVIEVEAEAGDDDEAANDAVVEVEAEIEDSQVVDKDVEMVDEVPAQVEDHEEPSIPPEQPASVEQPEPAEQDEPESRPDPSQPNPSQPGKRKKRRQSRKATFGEPDYRARAASPVLGSDPPRSQAGRPSKSKQPLLTQAQENALYEFVGDDEENHQEKQQGEKRGQTSTATTQAARKRGRPQSQTTRSPAGRRREVAENAAGEAQDSSYTDDDPEADEEPTELSDTEDQSGDEDEPDDEPELGNDSSVAEDSLLIEPPKENERAPTAKIHGKVVQRLVTIMVSSGWTGKRKWDRDAKLEAASAKRDFKEESLKKDRRSLPRSKVILAHLYDLWKLCQKIPRLPRLDEQNKYLREHKAHFNRLVTKANRLIDRYIKDITKGTEPNHDAQANQLNNRRIISKLHRHIIPMLVWLLRDAFLAGCDIDDKQLKLAVTHTGEFTLSTLQPLLRISGWIQRLCAVLLDWSQLNYPKPDEKNEDWEKKDKDWKNLWSAVEVAKENIDEALWHIEEIYKAPEKQKKALENDLVVQREREKKRQQAKEAQARQMQLFIESTQRKNSSRQVLRRPTQETSSSRPASHRPTKAGTQSHPVAPRLGQEEEAEYFEKHGWHYWEDDRLLITIRSARQLDYQVLASACDERSSEEVKERVKYLKDMVRHKYERHGTEPPLWTYET